ncbi:hypothetical protein J1605_023158, partial [Eschrichtius robustus]
GAPGPETEISGEKLRFPNSSRETEIWGCQTGGGRPLRAGLSPPLPIRLPGTGAEKSGVCPALEVDLNRTQECLSDGECADNLKCCRAGCATVCQMPNGNPGGPTRGGGWSVKGGGRSSPEAFISLLPLCPHPLLLFLPRKAGFLLQAGHRLPPAQPLTEQLPGKQHVSGQLRCCHDVCGKVSCVTPVF